MRIVVFFLSLTLVAVLAVGWNLAAQTANIKQDDGNDAKAEKSSTDEKASQEEKPKKIVKTPAEWRKQLSRIQFHVTREAGTERAFTGKYWNNKAKGVYACVCCGELLFDSSTKFKSGTGWPSFFAPIDDEKVGKKVDRSWFSVRTEVVCDRCDAHLGHVFNDGPRPTGLRYCLNSAALKFIPAKKLAADKSEEAAEADEEVEEEGENDADESKP